MHNRLRGPVYVWDKDGFWQEHDGNEDYIDEIEIHRSGYLVRS